jgi:ElaB/YqjD/DUF883 family membrane-anchored ribosome-binding protein
MMHRNPQPHIAEGDFTRKSVTAGSHNLKQAASHWAGTMKESVRGNLVKAGYNTETYVRSHPARFIAGACCVGLAAGWFIGRSVKRN